MRDYSGWSLSLGRWAGVEVRLHAVFVMFAAFAIYFCSIASSDALLYGAIAVAVLLVSVLLHEVAHCVIADRLDASIDQIVVGPLGGLHSIRFPEDPRREATILFAGPIANLSVMFVTGALIVLRDGNLFGLMHPLRPTDLSDPSPWVATLNMLFWVNWLLFLVNLLPAFPLDGGPALRALLTPRFGETSAAIIVARCARVTAFLLCIAAWLVHRYTEPGPVPAWLPLVLLAIAVFFSARVESSQPVNEDVEEDLLGYDFSQGYTSLERHLEQPKQATRSSPLNRWLEERRHARRIKQAKIEREEERRFDELLIRIHTHGMTSVTGEERALLDRVSARYRNRQQH